MPGNGPPILPIPEAVHNVLLTVTMHDDGSLATKGGKPVFMQAVAGAETFAVQWDATTELSDGAPVAAMDPDAYDIIQAGEWNDGYVNLGDALYGFQLYETDAGLDMRPVEIEMTEGGGAGFVQTPAPGSGFGSGLMLALGLGMVVAGAWRGIPWRRTAAAT